MKRRIPIIFIMWIVLKVSVAGPFAPPAPFSKNLEKVPETKVSKDVRQYLRNNDTNDEFSNYPNNFMTYYKLRTFQNMRRAEPSTMDWIQNVVSAAIQKGSAAIQKGSDMLRAHHEYLDQDRDHKLGGGKFLGGSCDCQGVVCLCCNKMNIFGLDNETCTRLSYDSATSTVNMNVKTQNHYHQNSFHVSEAKTKCFPLNLPYMEDNFLDICAGFYNISEPHDGLLHLCMAINGRIKGQSIITIYFDCMDMGENADAMRPPNYHLLDKNVPGPYNKQFPSTSPIPPSDEEIWTPEPTNHITHNANQISKKKKANIDQGNQEAVQGLARFLGKWLL